MHFFNAPRTNTSLTASTEKRVLLWMAQRLPNCVTSDGLTLLALAAQAAAGALYLLARTYPPALLGVILCILLNWAGDSLDGTLARLRCQERPRFGFYVDHLSDVLGATAMMAGLACSGFVHPLVALAMLLAFLLLAAESYLATYTLGRFELAQGPFGPTEVRLLLIAANLAVLRSPWVHIAGHRVLLFDLGGVIGAAGMLIVLLLVACRHTAQLYRAEPLQTQSQQTKSLQVAR